MRHLFRVFGIVLLALLAASPRVLAQDSGWQELRTSRFAILYTSDQRASANAYSGFVDGVYDEITAIFGHHTATPVTLRLYPTLERYYEINPLARGLTGVVAHADYRRHEVVVILPQTRQQTQDEIQNNVRHELAHIVASDLSENRLNVLFQEGIAQYVEHPSRELEAKIQILKGALAADQLLRWSDLDSRETFYRNAQLSYPQSLSIVAFLVERHSFTPLRAFLTTSAQSSGYRSALERAFGISPDQLEEQWRAWLPGYLAGGYRHNALSAYDLAQAEGLLAEGRYAEAQRELEAAITWLQTTEQTDVLQQARALLEQSIAGQRAEVTADEARAALEAGDYPRADELVKQARSAYAALDDTRQEAVLADYAARAARGLNADAALREARALTEAWRYPQARALADRAAADYAALGASRQVSQAQAIRATLDQRQSLLGALLLGSGILGIAASAWRRLNVSEAEAW